jgi:hypothetical protein
MREAPTQRESIPDAAPGRLPWSGASTAACCEQPAALVGSSASSQHQGVVGGQSDKSQPPTSPEPQPTDRYHQS